MSAEMEKLAAIEMLPCISLWQPYASLIFARDADGACIKQHETRGFRLPESKRGVTIGIHATANFTPRSMISEDLHELCLDMFGCGYHETLPRGGIIGTVRFTRCEPTLHWFGGDSITKDNFVAGDWRDADEKGRRRYGWLIDNATPLEGGKSFLPWKGKQGWFSIPAAALRARPTTTGESGL